MNIIRNYIWNFGDVKYHRIVEAINNIGLLTLVLNVVFSIITFMVLASRNSLWLFGLPIFIILIGSIVIGIYLDSIRTDRYSNDYEEERLRKENKRLKRIMETQSKMRNISVL